MSELQGESMSETELAFQEAGGQDVLRQLWDTSESLKHLFCLAFGKFHFPAYFYLFIFSKEHAVSSLLKVYTTEFLTYLL